MNNPLSTPEAYELFLYTLAERFPSVRRTTVTFVRRGVSLAREEGGSRPNAQSPGRIELGTACSAESVPVLRHSFDILEIKPLGTTGTLHLSLLSLSTGLPPSHLMLTSLRDRSRQHNLLTAVIPLAVLPLAFLLGQRHTQIRQACASSLRLRQ